MGKLEQDLTRHATVGVDTAPFIYLWERHPRYFVPSEMLFRHLKKPQVKGITSVIFRSSPVSTSKRIISRQRRMAGCHSTDLAWWSASSRPDQSYPHQVGGVG